METGTFATVITCIDGRAKRPVANWVHLNLHLNYVDLVTEPGPEKVITQGTVEHIAAIRAKVDVSLRAHHSGVIVLAAHHDCAGNPVSDDEHKRQVAEGTRVIAGWNLSARVIGLWVTSDWGVEVVCDSGAQGYIPEAFAVAITCVDGRAKRPLADWMKQHYHVHYVDLITEPEPDTALLRGTSAMLDAIQHKVLYSLNEHHPRVLAIAAHYDCGGNALSPAVRQDQVRRAARLVSDWGLRIPIVGIWLDEQWQAHIVCEIPARSIA